MNRDVVYGVIFVMGIFSSCHTRKVTVNRVDSVTSHVADYADKSIITTRTIIDTTFKISAHTITSTPRKVFVPFQVYDSLMTIKISYDSSGNVIAQATAIARVLVAKANQLIVRQNNIIAKTQDESHLIKRMKASKTRGMSAVAIAVIGLCVFGIIAVLLRKLIK